MLERFFANKVAVPSAVDDLLHDTFFRFFDRRSKAGGKTIDDPGRFLVGVAKNVLLEYWRSRTRRDRIDEIGDLSIADLSQGLPSQVSREEKIALVRELLRELPLNHQMVLEFHYWQHKSYKEIARMLDVKFGTVATWGHSGRRALQKKLAAAWRSDSSERLLDPSPNESVAAYPWYDPTTGSIDHLQLAAAAMVGQQAAPPASVPAWLGALEVPTALPDASAAVLSEISKGAWQAWVEAGRPR
ncbi:MAG: sigma-70 family RNA polymerase sigma factor [Deltaproteobacteria bacterium]|nr:sigma-70 family RNA polymerase sigma factor [Deltaproteobacteria bacterium]